MYFWRIAKLKEQMIEQPLSDREVLPYLIRPALIMGFFFVVLRHLPIINIWEDYLGFINFLVLGIGTYYVYIQNQGAQGQYLLQRYVVIGWVVSIRWLVVYLLSSTVLGVALYAVHFPTESYVMINCVYSAIATIIYYWLLGRHVHDVALRTSAAQPPELPTV
jgi:hypothetical protein